MTQRVAAIEARGFFDPHLRPQAWFLTQTQAAHGVRATDRSIFGVPPNATGHRCARLDHVGRLENASAEWAALARRTGMPPPPDAPAGTSHRRSDLPSEVALHHYMDTRGVNASVRARVVRAVCALYAVDYCLLPGMLDARPAECRHTLSAAVCAARGYRAVDLSRGLLPDGVI